MQLVIAETVGDYVVMYQHQRQQQKLRLQEKEEQLAQVARDKDELRVKLSSLQEMITRLISRDQDDPAPITETGYDSVVTCSNAVTCDVSGLRWVRRSPWRRGISQRARLQLSPMTGRRFWS